MELGSTPAVALAGKPQGRLLGTVPERGGVAFLENAEASSPDGARGGEGVPPHLLPPWNRRARELGAFH